MKYKQYLFAGLLACLSAFFGFGQKLIDKEKDLSNYVEYGEYLIYEGDTLLIQLDELQLLKKLKFKTPQDRRYYYWFRRKVHKAYPYAKMTQDKLAVINERLKGIKSKKRRKRYTKRLQKHFEKEFTDQLKKLTRTEGRILIKLIHRQTGETAFDLLKSLRSGWKAYWSDQTAKLFKLSLKLEYHPESVNEDYLIEDILQRGFTNMLLDRQASLLEFDYGLLSMREGRFIHIDR
jgi:hypothetical protein